MVLLLSVASHCSFSNTYEHEPISDGEIGIEEV